MEINFLGKLDICITASTKQLLILLCVVSCAWMHVSLNLGEPAFFFTDINAWLPLLSKIPNICHFSATVSSLMYSLFALVAFALFQL